MSKKFKPRTRVTETMDPSLDGSLDYSDETNPVNPRAEQGWRQGNDGFINVNVNGINYKVERDGSGRVLSVTQDGSNQPVTDATILQQVEAEVNNSVAHQESVRKDIRKDIGRMLLALETKKYGAANKILHTIMEKKITCYIK